MTKAMRRIVTTAVIIAVIFVLTIIMVVRTSTRTREDAIGRMRSLTDVRASMIVDYVDNAEYTLCAYSSANEITDLLLDPKNPDLIAAAQRYTKNFSGTLSAPDLEGIFVSTWNTEILAHTDPAIVGRVLNKEQAPLEKLRTSMLDAGDGVYNTGISLSPFSGRQIISMFKAVYDEKGDPIGLVGLGIYTDSLSRTLSQMDLNTSSSKFNMVNTADNSYIFCDDAALVGKATQDEETLRLCADLKGKTNDETGYYKKKGEISFYSYMAGKNWLLTIESPSKEVFSFSRSMNRSLVLFCTVCIGLIVVFNVLSIRQQETLQHLEQSKQKEAAITKSLHTAALKDILTDVNNRLSFVDDFSTDEFGGYKIPDCPDNPYCFIMFSLPRFSQINVLYGITAGDAVLAKTADILKEHYGGQNVYRTGSDEFVVAVQSPSSNPASVVVEVNSVLAELRKQRSVAGNHISIAHTAAVVKKSTEITYNVLSTLKDIINSTSMIVDGNATVVDLDVTQQMVQN